MNAHVRFICIYTDPIQAPSFCIRRRSTLKKHRVSLIIRHYEKPVSLWIRLDNYDSTQSHETIHEKAGYGSSFSLKLLKSMVHDREIFEIMNMAEYAAKRMKNERSKDDRLFVAMLISIILTLMLIVPIVNNDQ